MAGRLDRGGRRRGGAGAAVAAALALAAGPVLAAPAHADLDDLLFGLFDPLGGATDPGVGDIAGSAAAHTVSATEGASVPMQVEGTGAGQPVVEVSVGHGAPMPVALDTGSKGLEVSMSSLAPQDILAGLEHFSFSDIDVNAFPAGVTVGLDLHTSVSFGDGITAENVPVDAVFFSFPFSAIAAQGLTGAPVDGVLGVGPDAGGSNLITDHLPGDLGKGLLIDEPDHRLYFGAQDEVAHGLTPITTLAGAPYPGGPHTPDDLQVQIGDGARQSVPVLFDSGGKGGFLPSVVGDRFGPTLFGLGSVPAGTPIAVYENDQLLYTYTVTPTTGMTVLPDWYQQLLGISGYMSTGNAAFLEHPVYISNAGDGAMTIYDTPKPAS